MAHYYHRYGLLTRDRVGPLKVLGIIAVLVLVVLAGIAGYDKAADDAIHTLEAQGYTSVEITGRSAFIPKHYQYGVEFTAIGHNGQQVSGTVYSSAFYGNSVRLD